MNKRLAYLIIFLFGFLLYGASIFFDFSYFDDQVLILENSQALESPANLGTFFTDDVFLSDSNFYYRPILNVSLMFDFQVSGVLPWFYHFSNILIHILVACLLFALLLKFSVKRKLALFLSLLFLSHPALVPAVAWIPGRNDTLLALFLLASFLFFLKILDNKKQKNYLFFSIFFLLALFTKEAAIFFPFLPLYYLLFLNDKKVNTNERAELALLIAVPIFIWLLFRSLAIDSSAGTISQMLVSILSFSPAALLALGKFFLPFNLSAMGLLSEQSFVFALLAIVFVLVISFKKRIAKKWLGFSLLCFVLFLLPGFLNPDKSMSYQILLLEHRLYLPFIALIILLAKTEFKMNKRYAYPLGAIILILFITLSALRLPHYANRLHYWNYAVETSPNSPLAWRNLGVMLYFAGDKQAAEDAYLKSLALNKDEKMVHNNLGVIYMNRGDWDRAREQFKKELEVNPGYDKALNNLLILENKLR